MKRLFNKNIKKELDKYTFLEIAEENSSLLKFWDNREVFQTEVLLGIYNLKYILN